MNPGAKRLEAVAVKKDVHSIGGGLVRLKNFLCSLPSSISNLYTYKPPNIQGAHVGFPTVQQLDPFIFLKFYHPPLLWMTFLLTEEGSEGVPRLLKVPPHVVL